MGIWVACGDSHDLCLDGPPLEPKGYQELVDRFEAMAADNCQAGPTYSSSGVCDDLPFKFVGFGSGYGGQNFYYHKDTEVLVARTVFVDSSLDGCLVRYWPRRFECTSVSDTRNYCPVTPGER